ncbi:unnamed protein product [Chondrus crispus]|uniref:Uncharacterized protein n=1 Tax=Chondrus crispus TaxID=2769 RepID=R7QIE5_CHOCR|nr:unnamed protein product [Chondrus crispus]CDF37190.1 unnamed protein product [Chondrus crispus]|eukprot:XP_005717009.1 unnamed protein product [Chondrus crispus]
MERPLAAIVAAKVNFHLGSLDEALHYALSAENYFDVDAETEFANTLRARCIDDYISFKRKQSEGIAEGPVGASADHTFSAELESVVERVLAGCIQKGEIHEAIGVSIESRRLDKVEIAIAEGCRTDEAKMEALAYCFECAQTLISSRAYRSKLLNLLASLHTQHFPIEKRNFIAVANCYAFVGNAKGVADILMDLVSDKSAAGKEKENIMELTALQIVFDIVDNDAPFFASEVMSLLPVPRAIPDPPTASESTPAAAEGDDPVPMETDTPSSGDPPSATPEAVAVTPAITLTAEEKKIAKLRKILNGEVSAELHLDFLCSKNHSDLYLLKKIKAALDGRSSVCYSALLFSNAIAHSGTAIDNFLRGNLDWLARATAWAKFSATSCLGVIHGRHTSAALNLLSPYLPSNSGSRGSAATSFQEGGALYALGLITATGGRNAQLRADPSGPNTAKEYLLEALKAIETSDVVKHGACLGLGLSAMASWDGGEEENQYYEELKNVLYTDSAVASEAAGLGMGLIALGSGSDKVAKEMLAYAVDTEHEKIIRGLALGMALVCYGREDDADSIIKTMNEDSNPILRYGAMYAVALAYCGTADNKAIRLLLHSAVSDVSDDVRRAAVIGLGFVLFRHPKLLPRIVALLAESCHAHVRFGAALAIGIACMGTGMPAAVEMLERLTADPSDFVRQGALIGMALVYMHHTEDRSPKAAEMRKTFEATWSAKLEDVITRFGAVVAVGLADAGGRNGVIALTSSTGHPRMSAIVGLAMFTQFWYWYPMVHFIGLSIKPSALICLNQDVKMPKLKVQCNAQEGMYAYVPSGPPEKTKEVSSAPKAVLSTTVKSKARAARRAAKKRSTEEKASGQGDSMTDAKIEAKPENAEESGDGKDPMEDEKKAVKEEGSPKKAKFTVHENPCRVLPEQEKYMSWNVTAPDAEGKITRRYDPVVSGRFSGIVMMSDRSPTEPEDIVEMQTLNTAPQPVSTPQTPAVLLNANDPNDEEEEEEGEEVPPPEPFVYRDEADESKKDDEEKDGGDSASKEDADVNMNDSGDGQTSV